MFVIDIFLALSAILGFFLSLFLFLGYFRDRLKRILITLTAALIPTLVLTILLFLTGFGVMEGKIPFWCIIIPVPVFGILIYSLGKYFFKNTRRTP